MDSTQLTDAGAVLVISGAGRRASLPVAAVADIAAALPALKLPFAADAFTGDAFEGAVPSGGALTAQIDLVRAWGGSAGEGRYTLLVRTTHGPVRIRVGRVSGPAPGHASDRVLAEAAEPGCGLAEIEALLAGCLGRAPALPPPPLSVSVSAGLAVLVLQAGGQRIAVPAADVEAVAQVQAAWRPRGGGIDERIVALAMGLLPGCALADWLGMSPATMHAGATPAMTGDAWAVVMQAGGRRFAVTAERVHMPPRIPVASVEMLRLRQDRAVWLTDAAGARLELVSPSAFAMPKGAGQAVPELAVPPPRASRAVPRPTGGGVALRAGPFSCVLPQEVVGGVHTGLHPGPVRGPRAVPVFDAGTLLGLPRSPALSPLVVLHRPGRRSVALVAEAVTLAAPASDWVTLPPAPAALHAVFDAARPLAGVCQLRLRKAALAQRTSLLSPTAVRAAFRGWIDLAGSAPASAWAAGAPAGERKCSGT